MAKSQLLLQPVLQFLDNNGNILAGGQLFFYSPSTTTPKNTYTDITKTVANPNPIVLNSAGKPDNSGTPINVWFDGSYKMVIKDSLNNVLQTIDPVNTLGQLVSTRQVSASTTITEQDRDKFIVADASAGNIILTVTSTAVLGDGFQFSVKKIDSSANTVTIQFAGTEKADGQNTIVLGTQYQNQSFTSDGTQFLINSIVGANASFNTLTSTSATFGNIHIAGDTISTTDTNGNLILSPNGTGQINPTSTVNFVAGADIASASTVNLGAATGNAVNITGTSAISSFGTSAAGITRTVEFTGILTITYNATSMILPGLKNITTAVGDNAEFLSLGAGNWQCVRYTPIAGNFKLNGLVFIVGTTYVPTPGTKYIEMELLAGGGNGGAITSGGVGTNGCAGGGGSSAYLKLLLTTAQIGASATITIGAAGAGSSFVCTAGTAGVNPGSSGTGTGTAASSNANAGGVGGSISSTTIGTILANLPGAVGGIGWSIPAPNAMTHSGEGAASVFGPGGNSLAITNSNGINAPGFGAGGGGACSVGTGSLSGGNGGGGICVIKEYITL